jgi:hypothetical protein
MALLVPAGLSANTNVLPGFDLFQTDPNTTFQDFGPAPIPPNFFGPGSDPFHGQIWFMGEPLQNDPNCPNDDLSSADTIVERLEEAELPDPNGSSDVIEIEIIQLHLTSIDPIVVTFNGGQDPELWDVEVELSDVVPQPPGRMTITHTHANGGVFDSQLPVVPKFIFTRQSDNMILELDAGNEGPLIIDFQALNIPWVHIVPPDNSCTSNFCVNPDQVTEEQAILAAHGVLAICPEKPTQTLPSTWGRVKAIYH